MLERGSKKNMQNSLFSESSIATVASPIENGNNLPTAYNSKIVLMQHVIRKLRSDDLKEGHCFMIFDEELPEDQAYYEYPDGNIKIERLDKRNIEIPRKVVKVLNKSEALMVRKKHGIIC